MKNPRYPIFTLATVVICVSCACAIITLFRAIFNTDINPLYCILGILSSICIMSLFIVVNSLIERLADVTEKVVELNNKMLCIEADKKIEMVTISENSGLGD